MSDLFLTTHHFSPSNLGKLAMRATRDGFGEGLVEAGQHNPNVVALTADLSESTRAHLFEQHFPDRFIEVGVAEQNMMGIAAGLALSGKIPFATSYAVFSPGRNWDQLRVSVCYSKANVKIASTHTGLTVGEDGATHQALEDIAITRVLPNLTVLCPCDANQAHQATLAAARHRGPVYLRLTREVSPVLTTPQTPFEIGRAQIFREGTDVTIVACGPILCKALAAAENLATHGIHAEVINVHTIKPFDERTLLSSVNKTGGVVTVEEHQVHGGLGSAVAEVLGQNCPAPLEMIAVQDTFGESGTPAQLLEKYGLTTGHIVQAARKIVHRKHLE
jgi:transketolase